MKEVQLFAFLSQACNAHFKTRNFKFLLKTTGTFSKNHQFVSFKSPLEPENKHLCKSVEKLKVKRANHGYVMQDFNFSLTISQNGQTHSNIVFDHFVGLLFKGLRDVKMVYVGEANESHLCSDDDKIGQPRYD